MKLRKIKLSDLSDAGLKDKELNALRGGVDGAFCGCSCYWADKGGSSSADNSDANWDQGSISKQGCSQYVTEGFDIELRPGCNESNPGAS